MVSIYPLRGYSTTAGYVIPGLDINVIPGLDINVIPGLDPGIFTRLCCADCRVKPDNDKIVFSFF